MLFYAAKRIHKTSLRSPVLNGAYVNHNRYDAIK